MNNKNLVFPYTRKAIMLSALFLITFFSCKKDGELFPSFNNENLSINFTDSFEIRTSLLKDDSIRTDIAGVNLLGIYNDSIFGPASASFFTEITLAGSNVNFGNNAIIDSVVFTLKFLNSTSFYGKSTTPMSVEVYRLNEQFTKSEYYSNETLDYSSFPTPLGSLIFTPNMVDTVQVFQNGVATWQKAHLRIKLANSFGQEILDAGKGSSVIMNNTSLKNLVNGLYITPATNVNTTTLSVNDGAIIYFDMNSALSTVTVFYSNDLGPEKSYNFLLNAESKKFNYFRHNYTNTEINKQLTGSTYDSTLTYVQAMGGVKTKLLIPNIKNITNEGRIAINKAELVLNVADFGTSFSTVPILSLTGINEIGQATFLMDYFDGASIFGGVYDASTKTYKFNIARHLQSLIDSKTTDYGMYLVATGSSITANRTIINSFKHSTNKMKLNITYTKY